MLIGCIADDLTGATDLAVTLSREGLSVTQVNGVPEPAVASLARGSDFRPGCGGMEIPRPSRRR